MQGEQPPGAKKGSNVLVIVLAIVGLIALMGIGTCAVGLFWAQRQVTSALEGGAMVLVAPPEVVSELAGPKKDYVGQWRSEKGSQLIIDAQGNLLLSKTESGSTKLQAPIAAFEGNDMKIKALVTITVKVTQPPTKSASGYTMIVDGITMTRSP